jgi:hypothetical protein
MEQTFSNHSHGSSDKLPMNSTSGICYLELGSAAHPFLNENNYESYLQALCEYATLEEVKISGVVTSSREITCVSNLPGQNFLR